MLKLGLKYTERRLLPFLGFNFFAKKIAGTQMGKPKLVQDLNTLTTFATASPSCSSNISHGLIISKIYTASMVYANLRLMNKIILVNNATYRSLHPQA